MNKNNRSGFTFLLLLLNADSTHQIKNPIGNVERNKSSREEKARDSVDGLDLRMFFINEGVILISPTPLEINWESEVYKFVQR